MSRQGSHNKAGGKHAKTVRFSASSGPEVESLRLGRYPFAGGIPYYVSTRSGRWRGRTTRPEEERKLRQLDKMVRQLHADGKIKTMDPRHIDQEDVGAFLGSLTHYDPDVQRRHISRMNSYLKFFKNFVIENMLSQGLLVMPRCAHKNIRCIDNDDLVAIFEVAAGLDRWTGSVCRGMIAIYFATGVRPSELREAELRDLDLAGERIFVRHPKGEGSWAAPEWRDIIRGDMLPLIEQYLHEREVYLISRGVQKATFLFPNLWGGRDGKYSANSWRKIKQRLVKESKVDFRIKDFRSTLTSIVVNEDLSRLPAMSIQLGHAGFGTTQKFYADIQRSAAGKQLKNLWKKSGSIVARTPLIENAAEGSGQC